MHEGSDITMNIGEIIGKDVNRIDVTENRAQ
jgi:hypothetical protein